MESQPHERPAESNNGILEHAQENLGKASRSSRRLYRPFEVWAMFGISRDTFFGLIRKRELRSIKVGRLRLIPAEAIDEYVARKMAEEEVGREQDQ